MNYQHYQKQTNTEDINQEADLFFERFGDEFDLSDNSDHDEMLLSSPCLILHLC